MDDSPLSSLGAAEARDDEMADAQVSSHKEGWEESRVRRGIGVPRGPDPHLRNAEELHQAIASSWKEEWKTSLATQAGKKDDEGKK